MKPLFYAALLALSCQCGTTSAQQFIRGNCKPAHYLPPCTQSQQDSVNKNMGNCWINHGPLELFIGDATCGGDASHPYFIGIEYATGPGLGGVNVVFKLNQPMMAGTQYKFSFDYRTDGTNDGAFPIWYYNNDNDSVGRDSFFVANMPPSSTTWTTVTDSVTPKINCSFISLNAGVATSGAYSQTYITNIKMLGVPPITAVPQTTAEKNITISPNPSTGLVHITTANNAQEIIVSNMTGQVVYRKQATNNEMAVDLGQLPKSMYVVEVKGTTGSQFSKLLLQ